MLGEALFGRHCDHSTLFTEGATKLLHTHTGGLQ